MDSSFASSARSTARRAAKEVVLNLPVGVTDLLATLVTGTAENAVTAHLPILPRHLLRAGTLLRSASITKRFRLLEQSVESGHYDEAARIYREVIALVPNPSSGHEGGRALAKSERHSEAFTRAAIKAITEPDLRAMMMSLMNGPVRYQPSRLWLYFMVFNAFQIDTIGVASFKKTVNHNYFNWVADSAIETQTRSLQAALGLSDTDLSKLEEQLSAPAGLKPPEFTDGQWRSFGRLMILLYEYALGNDHLGLLAKCTEPELGSPLQLEYKGRLVTQDLCNSVVDVSTIFKAIPADWSRRTHIAELGAGHGRIENVLLRTKADVRVTIIDITPALFISQWYLSNLFPEKKIFKFREFERFDDVRAEFEAADIAFLLPHQVDMLPPKIFDGFINICSLQEMTPAQIEMWFGHIDRLCRGWFYSKQFTVSHNPYDDVTILRKDYPVMPRWSAVLDRINPGNESLFEVLYSIDGHG